MFYEYFFLLSLLMLIEYKHCQPKQLNVSFAHLSSNTMLKLIAASIWDLNNYTVKKIWGEIRWSITSMCCILLVVS